MLNKSRAALLLPILMMIFVLAACSNEPTPSPMPNATATTVPVVSTATTGAISTATTIPATTAPTIASIPSNTAAPTGTATAPAATVVATAPAVTATSSTVGATATVEQAGGSGTIPYAGMETLNTVATSTVLDIPPGDAYLSPDGKLIAWTDQDQLCIYSLDSVKGRCGSTELGQLDPNSVRWSPDSTRLVFTENFLLNFYDSDIWVIDAASGETTDLTDDGTTDSPISSKPDAKKGNIDLAPRWTADSAQILFIRNVDTPSEIRADAYTISPAGGDPELLGHLNTNGYATFSIDQAPDGKHLVYNANRGDGVIDGLWISDGDGRFPKKVYGTPGPVEVAFSADGAYALGVRPDQNDDVQWDNPGSRVATARGDKVELDASTLPQWAAWAPGGSGMAYIVKENTATNSAANGTAGLYLTDKPGEPGRLVLADADIYPPHRNGRYGSFYWASNNTVLVMRTPDLKFVLLQLASDAARVTPKPLISPTALTSPVGTATARPTRTARPTPTTQVKAAVDELDIPFGDAYLSPDGQQIAWSDGKQICFYAPDGTKGDCVALAASIEPNSLRWSPDSSKLTFTDDWIRLLRDPDIWVLDATSGELTNLTDDGVDKIQIGSDAKNGNVDVAPRWTADGENIVFVRNVSIEGIWQGFFYTVIVPGGEAENLGPLVGQRDGPSLDTFAIALSPDGKNFAYNIGRDTTPEGGLWVAHTDGSGYRQLLAPPVPANIEFSADSAYVSAYRQSDDFNNTWATSTDRVVRLTTGNRVEVDPQHPAHWAGFAPAGNGMVYVARPMSNRQFDTAAAGIYVNTGPGEAGKLVLQGQYIPPYRGATYRTLDWAANDTVLVMRVEDQKYMLLHLP